MITYDQYEQPDYFYELTPAAKAEAAKSTRVLKFIPIPRRRK
jgi:hypothetical protein